MLNVHMNSLNKTIFKKCEFLFPFKMISFSRIGIGPNFPTSTLKQLVTVEINHIGRKRQRELKAEEQSGLGDLLFAIMYEVITDMPSIGSDIQLSSYL